MEQHRLGPECLLLLQQGDITRVATDAIVNAANARMLGGGGVDAAIHRAAGPQLLEACRRVPAVHGQRCPTGQARITPGFLLPARHVIHTVGPIYNRVPNPEALLGAAYRSSLALANQHGLRSVAFPAISCGVFGYPLDEAAEVALESCQAHSGALAEVRFVLFGRQTMKTWQQAARALLPPAGDLAP